MQAVCLDEELLLALIIKSVSLKLAVSKMNVPGQDNGFLLAFVLGSIVVLVASF